MATCQQKVDVKHKLMDQFSIFFCLNISTESREKVLNFETLYLQISEITIMTLKMPHFQGMVTCW